MGVNTSISTGTYMYDLPDIQQQCARCVMDISDPNIELDEQGYCNHCTQLLQELASDSFKKKYSPKALSALVNRMKKSGENKEYDCILGISGGIDSCYTAYILRELGVRTLLVHMDNGWNTEEATSNIKKVADALGFDYESVVLDWSEFRELQLAFLKASVVEVDTPTDVAILAALHKKAAEHGIKYIISGGNLATEGILPAHWHYNAKDKRFLKAIFKRYSARRLKKFCAFDLYKEAYYKLIKGIRMVYLLNYISFDKEQAKQLLQQELDWQYYGGKHYESRYTRFIQSYLLPVKFNIDYRKATLSSQICVGAITRDEALKILRCPPFSGFDIEQEKKYVAKKLLISKSELEEIIAASPRSYKDYPNNEKVLQFFYRLYRKLFTISFFLLGYTNI